MSASEYSEEKITELTNAVLDDKAKGNESFKAGDNERAIEYYNKAIETGERFFKNIPEEEKIKLEENIFFGKFKSELKNSYSNLASVYLRQNKYNEIVEIDKHIIEKLDSNFDKSYARIIMAYENLKDSDNAINYYVTMYKKFNKETIKKYEEQLRPVQEKSKDILDKMKAKYKTPQAPATGGWKSYLPRFFMLSIILIIYTFGKGYLKNLFGGKDTDISKSSIHPNDISTPDPAYQNKKTDDSINLDQINDEDLNINEDSAADTDSEIVKPKEELNDKNSL